MEKPRNPRLNVHPETNDAVSRAVVQATLRARENGDPDPRRADVIHRLIRAGMDALELNGDAP